MIIAAACARPFVRAAAAAGFEVIAADAYCDADTRRDAAECIRLGYGLGGFEAGDFRRKIFPLLKDNPSALVYGSGFETQPGLLDEVAQRCQLLGNDAATVAGAKDPERFFGLLATLDIPFPELALSPPFPADGWLSKRTGGSGGTHVQDMVNALPGHYYQRKTAGRPCSLLFLADGRRVRVVGYNEQLLAPSAAMPYRYGGAVSQAVLPRPVRDEMLDAAQRVTQALGLRGLNSLDCLVEGARFRVLEVNPRLTATFALYDAAASGAGLFMAHLRACDGDLEFALPTEPAQAHLIYYASRALTIPVAMTWPEWVADIPPGGTQMQADAPLCTVMAAGDDAVAALALARSRMMQLAQQINQLRND